jgi:hypothetical protein
MSSTLIKKVKSWGHLQCMYESTVISRYAFRLYGRYVYCWQILKSNVNPTLEHTRNTTVMTSLSTAVLKWRTKHWDLSSNTSGFSPLQHRTGRHNFKSQENKHFANSTIYYLHYITKTVSYLTNAFCLQYRHSSPLVELPGSHGNEYEDGCLLGCCAMQSSTHLPMFQRSLLPPSLGWW